MKYGIGMGTGMLHWKKKKIVVDWVLGFGRHYVCFHDYFGICDMIMIDDDECLSVWIV